MPPKGQQKPKTKKELRAEAEAAAKAAEEERQRQEQAARQVAEQLEQDRQTLLKEFEEARDVRLQAERQELVQVLQRMQVQRVEKAAQQEALAEWERYVSCTPLPDPRQRPAMNDFLHSLQDEAKAEPGALHNTLERCKACLTLAQQCQLLSAEEAMTSDVAACLAALAAGSSCSGSTSITDTVSSNNASAEPCSDKTCNSSMDSPAATTPDSNSIQQPADADSCQPAAVTGQPAGLPARVATPPGVPGPGRAATEAACTASAARAAQYQQDAQQLLDTVTHMVDATTAHVLLHSSEYADDKGDVLVTAQQGQMQWGLFVNTHQNPRFKTVQFTGLGMHVDIPKQLALANIALRVQWRPCTSGARQSAAGCLSAVGGELLVDLLSLPPAARQSSRGWTVQQVAPQYGDVNVLSYPMTPVGADSSNWQPDEASPPLTFSIRLPQHVLVPTDVRVGWWDGTKSQWSEDGITAVSYDASTNRLSFSSTHLGCLALLHDTSAHLPYTAWSARPSGGPGGAEAIIDVQPPGLPAGSSDGDAAQEEDAPGTGLSLQVGSGWVRLLHPALPQLAHLLGKPLTPWELVLACSTCGLQLTPGGREPAAAAALAGLQEKDTAAEQAMCADLAPLCATFLVASSRWNGGCGPDGLLVRLSEVHDWDEGGRTTPQAAARIFSKETAAGPRQVLVARRQGALGVMWVDGGNNKAEPPKLPDLSTVEAVKAAAQGPAAWLHASLLHLLADRQHEQLPSEEERQQQQQQQQKEQVEGQEQPAGDDNGSAGPQEEEARTNSNRLLSLGATQVDASFVACMTQVLYALRLFSFS